MTTSALLTAARPPTQRRWFQYSLRSLLVLMTLACVGMSWFAVKMAQADRQREAVARTRETHGDVEYDWEVDAAGDRVRGAVPPEPSWLRTALGDDFFDKAVSVFVWDDESLEQAAQLPYLRFVHFNCTPDVTDAGLAHLHTVTTLRRVRIGMAPNVTAEGVAKLRRALPNCTVENLMEDRE